MKKSQFPGAYSRNFRIAAATSLHNCVYDTYTFLKCCVYVTPRWGETFSFETRRPVLKLDCTVSKLENGSHTQFWGNVRIRRKSILGYITVTVTVTVWAHSPLYLVAYLILFLPSRHRMLGDQLRSSWEEECWDVIEIWFSCQFYSD